MKSPIVMYYANYIQLGNKGSSSTLNRLLVAGVPTKATITFSGVSSNAEKMSLIQLKGLGINVNLGEFMIDK